jgi:hypothetical protein
MLYFLLNHPFAVSFFIAGMSAIGVVESVSLKDQEKFGEAVSSGFIFLSVLTVTLIVSSAYIQTSIGAKSETLNKYLNEGKVSDLMVKDVITSPFDSLRATFAQHKSTSSENLKILLSDPSTEVQEKARANLQLKKELHVDPSTFRSNDLGKIAIFMFVNLFIIFLLGFRVKPVYKYSLGALVLVIIISSYFYMEKDFIKTSAQAYVLSSLLEEKALSANETQNWINLLSSESHNSKKSVFLSIFARQSSQIDSSSLKLLLVKDLDSFDRELVLLELIKRKEIEVPNQNLRKRELLKEDLNFHSLW